MRVGWPHEMRSVDVSIAGRLRQTPVLRQPVPHIVVSSKKELHGWWPGKRECTAERMLVNPYNGCDFGCIYCYANSMNWGYFKLYRQTGLVTVFKDMDVNVARQLDSLDVAACGYLSPVTDPFQPVNSRYKLSERIVHVFTERGLPIDVVTKGIIPDEVIRLLAQNRHSFAQVSITTVNDGLRRQLSPGSSVSTDDLFYNLTRLSSWPCEGRQKIHSVCRIDPILPFITDDRRELRHLIERAKLCGADHIIASCVDIPIHIKGKMLKMLYSLNPKPRVRYEKLFTDRIDGSLHAHIDYRRELFSYLRDLCVQNELSFALCMEFENVSTEAMVKTASGKLKRVTSRGMNAEFMTGCKNCEGIDVPIYVRDTSGRSGYYTDHDGRKRPRFGPAAACTGACLTCSFPQCGVEDLAMGRTPNSRKDFNLRDYRRWSKQRASKKQSALSL